MATLGSLFDGSGGFPLAASLCGIDPVWASEIEPYPIAVTRSRFPKMKHLGDVSKVNGADIEPVDVVSCGSPCQDMSIAGKRAGLKHEDNGDDETTRSGLFMEATRIIKEMREATNGEYPTFAVWENVPGAFSSNKGEDFRTVLEELIKIVEPTAVMHAVPKNGWPYADLYMGDGWSLAYRVFDAQFWGVPQRRRRIYLVADLRGQRAREVLFEREGVRGDFETSRTSWETAPGKSENCAGADDNARKGRCVAYSFDSLASNSMKSRNPYSGCRAVDVAKTLDTTDPNPSKNQVGIAVVEAVVYTRQAFGSYKDCGVCSGMKARDYKGATDLVVENAGVDCRNFTEYPELYPTLQAKPNGGQSINFSGAVRVQYIVRRLTPTECARLQGFPDDWGHPDHKEDFTEEEYRVWLDVRNTYAFINGKQQKGYNKAQMLTWYNKLHTDSSEYKMWGNGIALPCALYCMQGIAEAILQR